MAARFCLWTCLGLAGAALVSTLSAQAPPRELTIDAIYDPETRVDFSGTPPTTLRWLDDSSYIQARRRATGLVMPRAAAT
jgi:hypothetical protein